MGYHTRNHSVRIIKISILQEMGKVWVAGDVPLTLDPVSFLCRYLRQTRILKDSDINRQRKGAISV